MVRSILVHTCGHGLAELQADAGSVLAAEQVPRQRFDVTRAADAAGDDRNAALECEEPDALLEVAHDASVRAIGRGAATFGEDDDLAAFVLAFAPVREHLECGGLSLAAGRAVAAIDRDLAHEVQEEPKQRVAPAPELGLGKERHVAVEGCGQRQRVPRGRVVAGHDDAAALAEVLLAGDGVGGEELQLGGRPHDGVAQEPGDEPGLGPQAAGLST